MKFLFYLLVTVAIFIFSGDISTFVESYAGIKLSIDWSQEWVIDKSLLEKNPFSSIICSPFQPPIFNIIFALLLYHFPESFLEALQLTNYICLFGIFILIQFLVATTTHSKARGLLVGIVFILLPSTVYFSHDSSLTLFISFLLILATWANLNFLLKPSSKAVILILIIDSIVVLTSSAFSPLWMVFNTSIIFFLFPKILVKNQNKIIKNKEFFYSINLKVFFILGVVISSFLPLKNYLLYNSFFSSSSYGYASGKGITEVYSPVINAFFSNTISTFSSLKEKFSSECKEEKVINNIKKTNGSSNFHHWSFLKGSSEMYYKIIKWRISNPIKWLNRIFKFYAFLTRPPHFNSITNKSTFSDKTIYGKISKIIDGVLFADLTKLFHKIHFLKKILPKPKIKNKIIPLTVFGFIIFPSFMIYTLCAFLVRYSRNQVYAYDMLLLICFFTVLWGVFTPVLNSNINGNQIRFITLPLFSIIVAFNLFENVTKIRLKK